MRQTVTIVLSIVASATPAWAGASTTIDRTGYTAIAAGDLSVAERRIDAERRIFPHRPELMLNLASVYHRTGRDADARALYQAVLQQPAVAMDLPSGGIASSHDLATRALSRKVEQIATR